MCCIAQQSFTGLLPVLHEVVLHFSRLLMCREWADGVEARGQATQYKLESELSGYKTNLIKESIRMGHHELADFFFARGDTQVRPLGSLIDSYSNQPYAAAVMGLPAAEPCLQEKRAASYKFGTACRPSLTPCRPPE